MRHLTRPLAGRKLAGVCAGFAEYLDVDVTFVRLAWLVLSIVPGVIVGGVLVYIAAWILIPQEGPARTRPRGRGGGWRARRPIGRSRVSVADGPLFRCRFHPDSAAMDSAVHPAGCDRRRRHRVSGCVVRHARGADGSGDEPWDGASLPSQDAAPVLHGTS